MTSKRVAPNGQQFALFYSKNSPFSNFYACNFKVTVDNKEVQFNCSEQYFMYQKAKTFEDEEMAEQILAATSPMKQKQLGRKVRNFDDKTWRSISQDTMEHGLEAKFSQNEDLLKELFDTGGATIVECSPRDRLWGIGMGRENPHALEPSKWRGKNLLGTCLMNVRKKLWEKEEFAGQRKAAEERAQKA